MLLQTPLPTALSDSIPTVKEELSMLKTLPVDELLSNIATALVKFSINLAIAILVFYVGRFIIRKIHKIVASIFARRNVDASLQTFVLSMVEVLLYFILIVTIIGILGIETSSFLALFASAGVAIGMALSGTLQNFAGGVLILLLKPYKVGDYIEVSGYAGTVRQILLFNTIITTPDNKSIIIPNGGLSTGSVNNYSREEFRRVDWTVSISYGDNVETARTEILNLLKANPLVICDDESRRPEVRLSALADSSVNLSVRAWCRSADYWTIFFDMNEKMYNELPKKGINFPFPQLDVHVQS